MDALKLIREYVGTQRELLAAVVDQYFVGKEKNLFDLPKHGILGVDDVLWEFQRHGAGVSFTQVATQQIVDAHVEMFTEPEGFDAWRLVQYFDSLGVESVCYGAESFDVTEERSIEALLTRMLMDGLLLSHNTRSNLYRLRH